MFPGLAVGEALVDSGVRPEDILYIGGSRLESRVYPAAGFPFLEVEIRGLQRSRTVANVGVPALVASASRRIATELRARAVGVTLGMGGYISVPAGFAARRSRVPLFVHEQNAEAGLANRMMSRSARRVFGSFPKTQRLPRAEWVGNPIRRDLAVFDRAVLRPAARERYRLEPGVPVVGISGGSLGASALNRTAESLVSLASEGTFAILHLTGSEHLEAVARAATGFPAWRPVGFEARMELFYAACDLVIARAGGAVAELTATATPAILVPGGFGSGHHQAANAGALAEVGAAEVVEETEVARLPSLVASLLAAPDRLRAMGQACSRLARPDAARVIARAMSEIHA